MVMNSDLARALAQLKAQPHIYFSEDSTQIKNEGLVIDGLRASVEELREETSLVFILRNSNDPKKAVSVQVHVEEEIVLHEGDEKQRPSSCVFATNVNLVEVFPQLHDWLTKNSIDGRVSAEAFFKGGMDIASKFGRSISIVLIHGQGRQEERQFSPCRRVH